MNTWKCKTKPFKSKLTLQYKLVLFGKTFVLILLLFINISVQLVCEWKMYFLMHEEKLLRLWCKMCMYIVAKLMDLYYSII